MAAGPQDNIILLFEAPMNRIIILYIYTYWPVCLGYYQSGQFQKWVEKVLQIIIILSRLHM